MLKSKDRTKELMLQRDKDRIEEVKRLLGGNKLDTTFQIPKRQGDQIKIIKRAIWLFYSQMAIFGARSFGPRFFSFFYISKHANLQICELEI